MNRTNRLVIHVLAIAVAAALALPAAAQATLFVKSDAGGLLVSDQHNRGNTIEIRGDSNGFRIINTDSGDFIPFFRGVGCTAVQGDGRSSFCERVNSRVTVELFGGTFDDSLNLTGLVEISSVFVTGGADRDSVSGHPGADNMDGGSGSDSLFGFGGRDTIVGGSDGDSALAGGTNNDTVIGGSGNDNIEGQEGNDDLDGGSGNDDIGNGPITRRNEAGDDRIEGGSGSDEIEGGSGLDTLIGESGEDVITSKEPEGAASKADQVNCGDDVDSVFADLLDVVSSSCEQVERSPVGETPHVRIRAGTLAVSPTGRVNVLLRCPRGVGSLGCKGTLQLRVARTRGRGAQASRSRKVRYRIRAGRRKTVRLRLTSKDVRTLRGRQRRGRKTRGILMSVERGRRGRKTTIRNPRLKLGRG